MLKSTCFGVLAALLLAISAGQATAYTPQWANGDGSQPLKWKQDRITISVSDSVLNSQLDPQTKREFMAVLRDSFAAWSEEADIEFDFVTASADTVSDTDSGGDGISLLTMAPTAENLLLFGERKTHVSAVTRLFFDSEGYITEADIVLNPTSRFSIDGSRGSFDLQATLTHEAGHLIGLGHSTIVSATMHRHQGKNGVFGIVADYTKTLSEDDAAGARYLYGPLTKRIKDYGALSGTLSATGRPQDFNGSEVWLESAIDGRVIAGITADIDGNFSFSSIGAGRYNIFAQHGKGGILTPFGTVVSVKAGIVSFVVVKTEESGEMSGVGSFGFNGQISSLAVTVARGKSHFIYVSGKSLDPNRISIECSSPYVSIDRNSISKQYERSGLVVLGFEVQIPDTVNVGEYSFRVYDQGLLIGNAPGVMSIVGES